MKARALQWLAQREQSRVELRRKLLRQAHAELAAATEVDSASEAHESVAEQVDAVLDWLESNGYLSAQRFVESRINARAARYGNLRIRQELQQHQLGLPDELAQTLGASEVDRACAVRARKFAELPRDAAERARQARFLIGRGFSSEAVRAALRGLSPTDAGEDDATTAASGT
ncbi:MAG TPA: regulatory protein RecX [Burkholderiaceae bacterium]|nr:regulatory protein RecX [Burkholderiaceae bacterium]